jgi:hypothetical protein
MRDAGQAKFGACALSINRIEISSIYLRRKRYVPRPSFTR